MQRNQAHHMNEVYDSLTICGPRMSLDECVQCIQVLLGALALVCSASPKANTYLMKGTLLTSLALLLIILLCILFTLCFCSFFFSLSFGCLVCVLVFFSFFLFSQIEYHSTAVYSFRIYCKLIFYLFVLFGMSFLALFIYLTYFEKPTIWSKTCSFQMTVCSHLRCCLWTIGVIIE